MWWEWTIIGVLAVAAFGLPTWNRFHPKGGDKGPAI